MTTPDPTPLQGRATEGFDPERFERLLREEGPAMVVDRLIAVLERENRTRELLDALLLKARVDLGLPPLQTGSLAELPEPTRSRYEDRYVEAIRRVGKRLLDAGDIPAAWPYFRAIAEKEPIVAALDDFCHSDEATQADADRLSRLIEIAFQEGAHPRRGFELILEHYGVCSAITAFEHLPPDPAIRVPCVDRLVQTLRDHLAQILRAEIVRHGEPEPPPEACIPDLIAGREWLFAEESYHIDISHLGSVVRYTPLATDPATWRRGVELAEYGRRLSPRYRYEGQPPFEDVYGDHAIYLRGLLGEDPEGTIAHFRTKLTRTAPDEFGSDTLPAQILVRLLETLGRLDEAIDVAAEHLAGVPDSQLFCSSLAELCQRSGRLDRLAAISRERNDAVLYVASILQEERSSIS